MSLAAGREGGGAPLILTADLPDDLGGWANELRTRHFPPERNHLRAHVTLFHALPFFLEAEVTALLGRMAGELAPVPARLEGIMPLGRGTALKLASPAMLALRDRVADHFTGSLTSQDAHRPRLHVTVQNKVSVADAKALQAALAPQVQPRTFHFPAVSLHRYRGGPWEFVRRFAFRGNGG